MSFNKVFWIVLIVLIVLVASAFYQTVSVFAMGGNVRADACRTYHVFAHQKELDTRQEIDGVSCGDTRKKNDDTEMTIIVETSVESVDNPIVANPIVESETPVETVEEIRSNPGNDKPVGTVNNEHCNQGMCENGNNTGEHGNSHND